MVPSDLLAKAMAFHKSGDFENAEKIYNEILKAIPDDPDVVHFLGIISWQTRDYDRAIGLYEKVCAANPSNVHYHLEYAEILQEKQLFKEALSEYEKVLTIDRENITAYSGAASLCIKTGDLESALKSLEKILSIKPEYPKAHCDIGFIYLSREKYKEAIGCFQEAIKLKNDYFEAYCYLGNAQSSLREYNAAIDSYKKALRINPDFFEAYYHLGICLMELNNFDQAIACLKSAVELRPNDPQAIADLSLSKFAIGDLAEAEQGFRSALKQGSQQLARIWSNLLLCINYMPEFSPAQLYSEHKEYGRVFNIGGPHSDHFSNDRNPDRKIRIGYVSADFCDHAISKFILPLLRWHNKDRYGNFCYSNGTRFDTMTTRLKNQSDNWRDIHNLSDERAIAMIKEDGIDILVDLSGHTGQNRLSLFARKPAPVQVSYLGYPNTTGLSAIDYYVTDGLVDPPGQELFFTERLVRLGKCFCCYCPDQDSTLVSGLPAKEKGHLTFGSLHTLSRLNDEVIDLWCRVLNAMPGSRMLIARNTLKGSVVERLSARFEKNGVSRQRIDMRNMPPQTGYPAWFHEIDIALDTFPWSGHTTACEALWMGVPVVTLRGDRHAGRMVSSILANSGMEDWITHSREEYCDRAKKAASDIENLVSLRKNLRGRMLESDLCNGKEFAEDLEKTFRSMWKEWCGKTEH
ncbi:MAG: tetratricopeptide repeat protein [Chitinivibrionales bacterium]